MARKHFTRGGKSVRETMWVDVAPTNTVLAAASTATLINLPSAGLQALRPFTIIRTRGILAYGSDQAAASENFSAALGYSVVNDDAAGIGVTAVPTPFSTQGSDMFFVYEMMAGRFEFISGVGFHPQKFNELRYDSKAMRKNNDDQAIAVVLEISSLSLGMNIFHSARLLIKLH